MVQQLLSDPKALSGVVQFDIPLLPNISDQEIVHLQCHIGTDTLSLARRGAKSVVGLDLSSASLEQARLLAKGTQGSGGENLEFVESDVYSAADILGTERFDLVFTGIGAICWIPSISRWASVVYRLLRPGGKLFIREGHPVLWTLDEKVTDRLVVRYPYFETKEPMVFEDTTTYVKLADEEKKFEQTKTMEWNHGLGEIVQALLGVGMVLTGLVEHRSVPWDALPGQMEGVENGKSSRSNLCCWS